MTVGAMREIDHTKLLSRVLLKPTFSLRSGARLRVVCYCLDDQLAGDCSRGSLTNHVRCHA